MERRKTTITMKTYLIKSFLKSKNLKYDDCTERQKQILKLEKPNVWGLYQWDI